jgi:hypothetical protein
MKDITVLREESEESDRNMRRSRVRDAIDCIVTDEGATDERELGSVGLNLNPAIWEAIAGKGWR